MKIIHRWEDVLKIGENSQIVLWGVGRLGTELICNLELSGFTEYYVCDSNTRLEEMSDNYISEQELFQLINRSSVSIVIAVKSDEAVKEIINKLTVSGDSKRAAFYHFISEDREELIERRREKGFYNGSVYRKVMETNEAIDTLSKMIKGSRPFLFSRWGTTEGDIVFKMKAGGMRWISDEECLHLKQNAGVFPITENLLKSYCKVMEKAATEIDMLCAFYWQQHLEKWLEWYSPDAMIVDSELEYPFFTNPWTKALEGMKVLVIHPFAKLMENQYRNRDKLFKNNEVLPEFELITYQAVQSMGGSRIYEDWIEALGTMQQEISKIDFDIALIGCGAYGMPLGAFIKSQMHKKAIHMGGSLQILFGIKGKRWEGNGYDYQHKLYNEYWVRPTDDLRPENYEKVEGGCYW